MNIKVCGIKEQENLNKLCELSIAMIGFNFYKPSKRYVDDIKTLSLDQIPKRIKSVGVFVNASIDELIEKQKTYSLDFLQLHGDENQAYITKAKSIAKVIKVFRIDEAFNFDKLSEVTGVAYYLFDTYTKEFGGSGKRFDWNKLETYNGQTPFLIAGGIGPEDVAALKGLKHQQFFGVDINSQFESEPGIKNIEKIASFVNEIN